MMNYGRIAELKSAVYLRKKGYSIIEHNYHSRFGEVDLIATNKKYIVFVEVKMRGKNSIAMPREFVDQSKQKKIIATAGLYISTNEIVDLQPRFDVIEINMDGKKIKSLKHLENAFSLV